MRLIETCSCGGSIEVIWTAPNSPYSHSQKKEEEAAKENIAAFREGHKNCKIMQAAGK